MLGLSGILAGAALLISAQSGGEPLVCPAPSAFDLVPTGYQVEFGAAPELPSGAGRQMPQPRERRPRPGDLADVETDTEASHYTATISEPPRLETRSFLRVLYAPSSSYLGDIICVYRDEARPVNLVLHRECSDHAPGRWRTSGNPAAELECDESRTACVFRCQD